MKSFLLFFSLTVLSISVNAQNHHINSSTGLESRANESQLLEIYKSNCQRELFESNAPEAKAWIDSIFNTQINR